MNFTKILNTLMVLVVVGCLCGDSYATSGCGPCPSTKKAWGIGVPPNGNIGVTVNGSTGPFGKYGDTIPIPREALDSDIIRSKPCTFTAPKRMFREKPQQSRMSTPNIA